MFLTYTLQCKFVGCLAPQVSVCALCDTFSIIMYIITTSSATFTEPWKLLTMTTLHLKLWANIHSSMDCRLIITHFCSRLSDHSDFVVSPPVTSVDTVTVHLHSQCSGACSDVQETAEVQSWAERWWVVQHPSAVPVPPVKQGCCLPPRRGRGQCQSRSRRGGATNKGGGGGGREDAG